MRTTVQIIGIIITALAIVYFIKPDILRRILGFFAQGKRLYLAGLIRFILAVVFLLAAHKCQIWWVIVLFGILFIISGLLVFMIRLQKLVAMLRWYQRQSNLLLRVIAAIVLAVGAIIIYSA